MTDFTGSNTPADQRDLWRTPPALFASLDAEFFFQLDAAASTVTPYQQSTAKNAERISQSRGALPFPAARRARSARVLSN